MHTTYLFLCGPVQILISLLGKGLRIWSSLTNRRFANGACRLEERMWVAFLKCLSRLQSARWTGVFAMPGSELPLKKL